MNLGEKTGPMILFGGPYSNFHALAALQKAAKAYGIHPHNIICTGDIVAYCGQAIETTESIQQWGIHVLMGNCEESFAHEADDCGCGFEEGSQCDLLSASWYNVANRSLLPSHRQWFAQLPRQLMFTYHGKTVEVAHGSIRSINQFLFPSDADEKYQEQLAHTQADIIISGHSGIPFSKKLGERLWHNAGAIGMPANDGTQNTWYSLMSVVNNTLQIETKPLHYDYQAAAEAMSAAGLNNAYAHCLKTGLWPSMDVLPHKERSQRGTPLGEFITYI